ncbi:Pheromone-binding protein-related protein 2 [Eufriesea mexicana]|uniref:Pheromone-binding protein-related protein 2 n=1 Tax=Eufriesea mexicana TaxID=516756 RepID=A0A310SFQ1_9HYME|nr:Pheromone-binding protein-related protein 2 [Eufriesea mexicana]
MIATAASVVNACQTQTGVTTVDIEAVRNGQWPETRQLKCYMYCLWEQFGLVDDKSELSLNGMLTFFQRIPAYRAEVQKAISECKGIEIIEDTEYGEFPDDDKLKCYFKCVLEKFKMMDKDGKIKYNLLKKVIPNAYKELGNEMIDSCSDVDDVDKCEKSFKFMKCMYEVNPIAFIAP